MPRLIHLLRPDLEANVSAGESVYYRAVLPSLYFPSIVLRDQFIEADADRYAAFVFSGMPEAGTMEMVAALKAKGKRIAWDGRNLFGLPQRW